MKTNQKPIKITDKIVRKLNRIINGGLCHGAGAGGIGDVCVQQAVATAIGITLTDHPTECVNPTVCKLGIRLNDTLGDTTHEERAELLRAFAIAELGSIEIDPRRFSNELKQMLTTRLADALIDTGSLAIIEKTTSVNTMASLVIGRGLDRCLEKQFIAIVVEALRRCGSPGCQFLPLINYNQGW